MGSSVSVLTVASPAPTVDATALQKLFPELTRDDIDDNYHDGGHDDNNNNNKINPALATGGAVLWSSQVSVFFIQASVPSSNVLIVDEGAGNSDHNNNNNEAGLWQRLTQLASENSDNTMPEAAAAASATATIGGGDARLQVLSSGRGDDTVLAQITLPGGGLIYILPRELLMDVSSRMVIAQRLAATAPAAVPVPTNNTTSSDPFSSDGFQEIELGDRCRGQTRPPVLLPHEEDDEPPNRLPEFPTLRVKLIGSDNRIHSATNSAVDFPINTTTPVPVETDLFRGRLLFVLRPTNPAVEDPYWNERIFASKKRRIVIQIQGQFKYVPQGIVYAGAEVSEQMKLGLVTRGLSSILLRLVESFNSNVHYSFGDARNLELPHIVVPAYTFFERLVVTPPGETPPPLEEPLEEPAESISLRRKSKSFGDWNTTDTYSFSFYSMYIDLPSWYLVSLPLSGNIHLRTFWGNSFLRICMYEKTGPDNKRHLQEFNRYAFVLQTEFLGKDGRSRDDDDNAGAMDDGDGQEDVLRWSENRQTTFLQPDDQSQSGAVAGIERPEVRRSDSFLVFSSPNSERDEYDQDGYFFDAEQSHGSFMEPILDTVQTPAFDLLMSIDQVCPAWIDVCSKGGQRVMVVNVDGRTSLHSMQDCEELLKESKRIGKALDENFSPRLSLTERTRRALGFALSRRDNIDLDPIKVQRLLGNPASIPFLTRGEPSLPGRDRTHLFACSFVARALSDRHWIEEWAQLTRKGIVFYNPEKRSPSFLIRLRSMSGAKVLPSNQCPNLPDHRFLVIETPGRSVYLMMASDEVRDMWLNAILERMTDSLQSERAAVDSSYAALVLEVDNPAEEFMHNSSMWNCKQRRILNCTQFSLRCTESVSASRTLVMVQGALEKALEPVSETSPDFAHRRAFLECAAQLKTVDVNILNEDERTTFFLNLYHVMIMHAFIVLGPPDSSLKWISYFNNIAYQVSDDIFALSELEHGIIRARMSYPSQFLSRFVIPKSRYRMALTRADFRVNFALNCGSTSNPNAILIYRVDKLEEQLEAASRLYLSTKGDVVRRSSTRDDVLVTLPRICQWFIDDFGGSLHSLLEKVEPYLPSDGRSILVSCRLLGGVEQQRRYDMERVRVRFHQYSFECRPLSLHG